MRFAIPCAEGKLCLHFGHCESFAIVDADDAKVSARTNETPPPHEPGLLPRWLKELGAFMDRHGYRNYRDFRDLAVGKITSADKLTLHGGYAEVDLDKCTGCGLCSAVGHCNAITIVDKKSRIDRKKCLACSTCVDVCPTGAMRMVATGILEKES